MVAGEFNAVFLEVFITKCNLIIIDESCNAGLLWPTFS